MKTRTGPRSSSAARPGWLLALAAAVAALALLTGRAFAQDAPAVEPFDLTGVVVDETGTPLVGAFVSFAGDRWGSLTGDRGQFVLPDVDPGRIELSVEQLGYRTLSWVGEAVPGEALRLTLEAQPVLLQGLTVVTDRFRTRRNAVGRSVRAFDRDVLATSTHETMVGFLQARAGLAATAPCPRLSHSTYCVWSRGRIVEPSIYIDEMPVIGGMAYLDSYRPHELYLVEVYAGGRHIRAYTERFMKQAAQGRLQPVALIF